MNRWTNLIDAIGRRLLHARCPAWPVFFWDGGSVRAVPPQEPEPVPAPPRHRRHRGTVDGSVTAGKRSPGHSSQRDSSRAATGPTSSP